MKKRIKKVFTFLDFDSKIPVYFKLCLKTWENFFPSDYKIIPITPKTVQNYLDDEQLKSLKKITSEVVNYIKACVLYSNGGIFMEADTLLLKEFNLPEEMLENHDIVVFGNSHAASCSGFMMAQKGNPVLKEYIKRLEKTLSRQEQTPISENKIFNDMLSEGYNSKALVIDAESSGYLAEKALYGVSSDYLRTQLYFSDSVDVNDFYNVTKGIVSIHCKNISEKYLDMREEDFLSQDNLLAKIFNKCLKGN